MTKQTGLGMGLYITGVDVSGDVGSFGNIAGGFTPINSTGIDKSAYERLGGKRTGSIDYQTFFNPAVSGSIHSVLKNLPTTDQHMLGRLGSAMGSAAFAMVGKQVNYDPKRGNDGSLIFGVNAQANGFGIEWGDLLTAGVRTDTGATFGPAFDTGGSNALGGYSMYVHLLAFTGTSVTIKLQESDDGGADPFADSGATTSALASAPSVARVTGTTPSIGQFLRVTTTGTFSNAQFVVMVSSYRTAVAF